MKNIKFKLRFSSKKVTTLNDISADKYIQKHSKNVNELFWLIKSCVGIDFEYKLFKELGFEQEITLFLNILEIIAEAKYSTLSYAFEAPCYPVEFYQFFKFSKKQKNEKFETLCFLMRNADHIKECEETSLTEICKISVLTLLIQNFNLIIKYIKLVKEAEKKNEKKD